MKRPMKKRSAHGKLMLQKYEAKKKEMWVFCESNDMNSL